MKVSDKYLLDLLREVVSIRAGGVCEYPGCCETICDPHHWYSKKNLSIRYDPDACLYLCNFHHAVGRPSAHLYPEQFKSDIFYHEVRSPEWANRILMKKNMIITGFDDAFRETCKYDLQSELRRLAA